MTDDAPQSKTRDHRSEPREMIEKYHTVQFSLNQVGPAYMFKLRDMSRQGLCILVRRDSAVLKVLKVGDVMDMQFLPPGSQMATKRLRTEIRHITRPEEKDLYRGHFMVGLSIIDRLPMEA